MTKPFFPPASDPLLTTGQAAKLLQVNLRSVQLWVESGKLPSAHTPGGHRRINTSDVHALQVQMGIKPPRVVARLSDEQIGAEMARHGCEACSEFARAIEALVLAANRLGDGDA